MKIRKITISNLNSLYGIFEIDLTSHYYDSGLFLIKGDKGSGKSTILDAICLAMYGETPRLGGKTAEILSQGEKNGFSEVEFELDGEIYLVRYGILKKIISRGANKGEPKYEWTHTLHCGSELLAERSAVAKKMYELLGIQFDDFSRVILLSQGNFSAFLNSGKDKGEILEKITGTEIYSAIGAQIFESWKESKDKVERKAGLVGEIQVPTDEDLERLQVEQGECQRKLELIREQMSAFEDLCAKFDQIREKRLAIEEVDRAMVINRRESEAFAPQKERLQKGRRAAAVASEQKAWSELSQERVAKEEELLLERQKERKEQALLEQAQVVLGQAMEDFQRYEKERLDQGALFNQVRALDVQLLSYCGDVEKLRSSVESRRQEVMAKRESLSERIRQREEFGQAMAIAQQFLQEHTIDQSLGEKIPEWLGDLNQVKVLRDENARREKEKRQIIVRGAQIKEKLLFLGRNESRTQNTLQYHRDRFAASEKVYQSLLEGKSKEHWQDLRAAALRELTLTRTIEDLALQRSKLEEGKPCPLCGSLQHPYAEGVLPQVDEAQKRFDQLENRLKRFEWRDNDLRRITEDIHQVERKLEQIQSRQKVLQTEWDYLQENWRRLELEIRAGNKSAAPIELKILREFEQFSIEWDNQPCLPDEFEVRRKMYESHRTELEVAQKRIAEMNTEVAALQSALEVSESVWKETDEKYRRKAEEFQALKDARRALYGEKDPGSEEKALKERGVSIMERKEYAQREQTEAKTHFERTSARVQALTQLGIRLLDKENALYLLFVRACEKEGFAPDDYASMALSSEEIAALTAKESRLETEQNHLVETKKNLVAALEESEKTIPPSSDEESLREDLLRMRKEQEEWNQSLGELSHQISRGREDRARRRLLEEELHTLKVEEEYWGILNKLLGGDGGGRFRRLAQEQTLGELLDRANRELKKMDGRYELIPGEVEGALEIDVCDHWQDETFRSAKNLSGGEQFIVSLALALGLSSMVGDKLQIDSLFLDEGFGTLDERALDQVIRALYTLQEANGKSIGIISHVEALAESDAIQTAIQVTPIGNGRSILEGPGARRLS